MTKNLAIGIDLGTTYSCVSVFRNGKVEIISNDQGHETTPSYVAFNEVERLVGDAAKAQLPLNPDNTIFDAKRLVGRRYDDSTVQEDMKHWPFKVINANGRPKIEVEYKNEKKTLYPEEVSSMVLAKMKETAESYLGQKVKDAVITVPAYFNDAQRQATKDAGRIAGLNVMRIINEPTAAAIAYGLDRKSPNRPSGTPNDSKVQTLAGPSQRNVLIFDLGGGTFDVSILSVDGGLIEVKATNGNTHLGGEDFDNRLVKHFVDEFKKKYDKDLRENKRALARLKNACEEAKRTLTSANMARIAIDAILDGIDYHTSVTRAFFEELNADLFRDTLEPVELAMKDADMEKEDIHDIVLIGGSTRIPKVQKLLQEYFDGRELNKTINPDVAVAYGAAVQAAILAGDDSEEIEEILLMDITPLSLGIGSHGDKVSRVVQRNTSIPTRVTKVFTSAHHNQTIINFPVYEGERVRQKDNNLLGEFELRGIPPARRGEAKVDVTFEIDANGILQVTAVDRSTGNSNNITITNDSERLTADEVNRMVAEAEIYRAEDEIVKANIDARNKLEGYCFDIKYIIDSEKDQEKLTYYHREMLFARYHATLEWIKRENPDAESCNQKLDELMTVCDPLIRTEPIIEID